MAKTAVAASLPPLPPVSVDFGALQQALREGKSGEEAIALATENATTPAETPAPSTDPTE